MKPYASYKPSGVPWLGDVPSHWRVMPIRYLSRGVKTGGTPSQEAFVDELSEGAIPWYAPADLRNLYLTDSSRIVATEFSSDVDVFDVGTIALVGIGDVGRVAMLSVEGTGNQQLNFIRPVEGVVSKYLTYAFMAGQEFVRSRANVTLIPILNQESTKRLPFVIPDLDEQQAIVDYLDVETARIDTLIHEKDELTGFLKEWRQTVIVEAVTKGVDKTATFASHPDPWIGLYPTHWTTKKLKYLGMFRAGAGFPVELQGQMGNPLPFFKVKDIDGANENGVIRESDSTVTPETALSLGAKVFPPHAIVFAKVGAALLLNRFRLLGSESCIDNNMMGFVLHQEIANHRFMFWAMQRINFSEIVNPGTVPSLNEPLISNLHIAVPLLSEQQAIADYLDAETAKIDDLIAHTHDEITLLKELRAATIADAVLGRVDVRTKN